MSTDRKPLESALKALANRMDTIEERLLSLELQGKTQNAYSAEISKLRVEISNVRVEQSNLYADINNKIASINGRLSISAKSQTIKPQLPAYYALDLEEEQKLKAMGMNEKQIADYARQKAYIEEMAKLTGIGSHQQTRIKEGNDTLNTDAPSSKVNGNEDRKPSPSKGKHPRQG